MCVCVCVHTSDMTFDCGRLIEKKKILNSMVFVCVCVCLRERVEEPGCLLLLLHHLQIKKRNKNRKKTRKCLV